MATPHSTNSTVPTTLTTSILTTLRATDASPASSASTFSDPLTDNSRTTPGLETTTSGSAETSPSEDTATSTNIATAWSETSTTDGDSSTTTSDGSSTSPSSLTSGVSSDIAGQSTRTFSPTEVNASSSPQAPGETIEGTDQSTLAISTIVQTPSSPPAAATFPTLAWTTETGTAPSSTLPNASPTATVATTATSLTPDVISDKDHTGNHHGLTGNATVGLAAGSGLAGAIIAGVTIWAWIFLRRRRPRGHIAWSQHGSDTLVEEPTLPISIELPRLSEKPLTTTHAASLELLPPLSATVLTTEYTKLKLAIKDHAQWYYDTTTYPSKAYESGYQNTISETLVRLLGKDAPIDATTLLRNLQTPQTRLSAIRILINWTIIKNISLSAPLDKTLLPTELVRCVEAIETDTPNQPSTTTSIDAFRLTAATLFHPIYTPSTGHLDARDPRKLNIGDLVEQLVYALQPWIVKGYGGARVRDLERVVVMGAHFGYMVFVQPGEWGFEWGEGVVAPGMVRIREGGERKVVVEVDREGGGGRR